MIAVTPHAEGAVVPVRAQPGARKDAVLGEHAGALRISVTAAPDRGQANAAIARVLAEAIGCRTSQIEILTGQTARTKRFLVRGLSPKELLARLGPPPGHSAGPDASGKPVPSPPGRRQG